MYMRNNAGGRYTAHCRTQPFKLARCSHDRLFRAATIYSSTVRPRETTTGALPRYSRLKDWFFVASKTSLLLSWSYTNNRNRSSTHHSIVTACIPSKIQQRLREFPVKIQRLFPLALQPLQQLQSPSTHPNSQRIFF